MGEVVYWTLLILCSIPLYLLIGWTIFDSKQNAGETFVETVVTLIKMLLIPRIVRVLLDMDDEGALGVFPIALFIAGCIAFTYMEHFLIQKIF